MSKDDLEHLRMLFVGASGYYLMVTGYQAKKDKVKEAQLSKKHEAQLQAYVNRLSGG